jgi:putative ABC transport system permease protein
MRSGAQSSVIEKLCRAYGLMMRAYPRAFRERFGREMQLAFRSQAYRTSLNQGGRGLFFFLLRTSWDWIVTLGREHCDMLIDFAVTALRNIARQKLYSFINIVGLAVGLTCAILIILFVQDELSYDRWISGSENLWRVEATYHLPGRTEPVNRAQVPFPIPAAMRDQIPEVQDATRLAGERMTFTAPDAPDRQFAETVGVADANFLQMVPLPLVKGDPRTVLARPENLVLSESAARKYFGNADPIGKTLTTGRGGCTDTACANQILVLKVVGVMRDLPHNTHLAFDVLMPDTSLADRIGHEAKTCWLCNNNNFAYIALAKGARPADVIAKLKPILDRNINISAASNIKAPGSQLIEIRLTPFRDAHLTTDRYGALKPPGSRATLYGMSIVGFLILLVASFNFMNLATAQATLRAREIGLRKVVGARRGQLMAQYLCEAVMTALIALALAFALSEALLPSYGRFLGRPLALDYLGDWPLTLGIVAIAVLAGLLSGLYPALVLSGLRPATTLHTNAAGLAGAGRLRTALVVVQFAVSIGLGIATLVMFEQMQFVQKVDLGFDRDNVVMTNTGSRLTETGIRSFVQALARGPGIAEIARTDFLPFNGGNAVLPMQREGDTQPLTPHSISVSENYFQVFHIRLLAGRALEDNREADNFYATPDPAVNQARNEGHNIMVNASLAKALGYKPADIIGRTVIVKKGHMRVVGVVADTLPEGVRSPMLSTAYFHNPDSLTGFAIRIAPGHTQEALTYINRISRAFVPGVAPSLFFLNDSYERLYAADRRQDTSFTVFVCIAIFIACLGLFGLAAFTAGRRTKEIGIRKVFGARVFQILWLLLTQFSAPVLLANLIAWPIAWYYLNHWLQGFAYRITLSPGYFIEVGLAALVIAWATVLSHALRVANANPIHALRYE